VQQVEKTMAYANFLIQSGTYGAFSDNGPASSMDDFNLVLLLHLARERGMQISFGDLIERKLNSEVHYLKRWKDEKKAGTLLPGNDWQVADYTSKPSDNRLEPLSRDRRLVPLSCDRCRAFSYLGHIKWLKKKLKTFGVFVATCCKRGFNPMSCRHTLSEVLR